MARRGLHPKRGIRCPTLLVPLGTALMAALAVVADPSLYTIVVLADLGPWLSPRGGHLHAAGFDTQKSFAAIAFRCRPLVMVMMNDARRGDYAGAWLIGRHPILQWFHYTRQSIHSEMYSARRQRGGLPVRAILRPTWSSTSCRCTRSQRDRRRWATSSWAFRRRPSSCPRLS